MHIYAFGSICRGEIDQGSDVDLLACTDDAAPNIDLQKYSLYGYARLRKIWNEGNPFAWHLHLESKLIYSSDCNDFLASLGSPSKYNAATSDCEKFRKLFDEAYKSLIHSPNSSTFHLSCIFLSIRNLATCYSLNAGRPIFSRRSPLMISPALLIEPEAFEVLTRARILSTRGYGTQLTEKEINLTTSAVSVVPAWMESLVEQLRDE